ncbi:MAG: hypothetical protein RBG13Loki_3903 [Promethearchaeota archaeon CR_4]|nr:MAG: hypothetical protein RBG13Loki_3903 [Candidatus Lokiarchaeota archaeon CR_4]
MDRFTWKQNVIFPWTKASIIVLGYIAERPSFFYDSVSARTCIEDPEILAAIGKEAPYFGVLGGRGRDLIIGEITDPINTSRKIPIISSIKTWKSFEKERAKLIK